ncbi:hypothetical protein [Fodinicurvata fenggangensis]|uniref:hypothetical protein n=1 Tax=Fodinicurvata fenggangensis TaxID=1121830 RepID=UPI00047C53EA|nr:hypothetical protein [Fodinicurvata fenggangensis]
MSENVHIGFSYQEGLPKQIVQEFIDEVSGDSVIVRSESRPPGYYANVEWAVPTIIVVYILRPYFEAFLGEAGKEHYVVLKRAFLRLFAKIYGKKPEDRPSDRSHIFSIQSGTRDGRPIKFIFPEGVSHETYATILEELLVLLAEHHDVGDGYDRLSQIVAPSSGLGGALYVEYSVSAGQWILLDPKVEIAKRRNAMRSDDSYGADF